MKSISIIEGKEESSLSTLLFLLAINLSKTFGSSSYLRRVDLLKSISRCCGSGSIFIEPFSLAPQFELLFL